MPASSVPWSTGRRRWWPRPDAVLAAGPASAGRRWDRRQDHQVAAAARLDPAGLLVADGRGARRRPGMERFGDRQAGVVADRGAHAVEGRPGDDGPVARESHGDARREHGRERQEARRALLAQARSVGRPGPGEELGLDDGRHPGGSEPGHERGVEEHGVLDAVGRQPGRRGRARVERRRDPRVADGMRGHRPAARGGPADALREDSRIVDGPTLVGRVRVGSAQPGRPRREGPVGLELDVGQPDPVAHHRRERRGDVVRGRDVVAWLRGEADRPHERDRQGHRPGRHAVAPRASSTATPPWTRRRRRRRSSPSAARRAAARARAARPSAVEGGGMAAATRSQASGPGGPRSARRTGRARWPAARGRRRQLRRGRRSRGPGCWRRRRAGDMGQRTGRSGTTRSRSSRPGSSAGPSGRVVAGDDQASGSRCSPAPGTARMAARRSLPPSRAMRAAIPSQ